MSETKVLGNIKLVEIFSDFDVSIRGSYAGIKKAGIYTKTPTSEDIRINIKRLREKYANLNQKYKGKPYTFFCEKVRIGDLNYWRFGRRSLDPKERAKLKDVPLYYSTTFRRLYIPRSYATKKKRLVASAIMYRCNDLGISLKTDVKRRS